MTERGYTIIRSCKQAAHSTYTQVVFISWRVHRTCACLGLWPWSKAWVHGVSKHTSGWRRRDGESSLPENQVFQRCEILANVEYNYVFILN